MLASCFEGLAVMCAEVTRSNTGKDCSVHITQVALLFTHHRFLNEMRRIVFGHATMVDGNLMRAR